MNTYDAIYIDGVIRNIIDNEPYYTSLRSRPERLSICMQKLFLNRECDSERANLVRELYQQFNELGYVNCD